MSNDFTQDHYTLFGLPRRYAIDPAELERLYREVLTRVHPDKHISRSDAEQRLAMQWSTQANEAYQTLRRPLQRAQYLLHLAGIDVQLESNTAMPTEFLAQQMEWREAVEETSSAGDIRALEQMRRRIEQEMSEQYRQLEIQLDVEPDHLAACATVRQMMFQEKLLHEIDDALETLEA
ncbi:MAG: Fe-S protein assembly co-chaperone HscB [Sterolibacterium sp.]|nr:Fe-S protein assembly co-chaperone HscB [Sterolibacterium sp.]